MPAPLIPPAASAPAAAPSVAALQADLQALQAHIQGMEQDLAALQRTMAGARRMHAFALALSALLAGAAWWLELSVWLRYYVFPLTLGLVLLFTLGTRCMAHWMARNILHWQAFADHASVQLASAGPLPAPPKSSQP